MSSMSRNHRTASRPARRRAAAFTLVELLTVIAIIAILAAIIFPVFSTVQENTRRTRCIDNMRKLYQGVKSFELDNRRYPDYLFGPALNDNGTVQTTNSPQAGMAPTQIATFLKATIGPSTPAGEAQTIRNVQAAYRNSLFPEYVNSDLNVYSCPNNLVSRSANDRSATLLRRIEQDPNNRNNSGAVDRAYYLFDSYDANPALDANGNPVTGSYQVRFSRVWLPLLNRNGLDALSTADREAYQNQLVFQRPSSDTYITMCTYHASRGKVVVLWMTGTAKVLDTAKLSRAQNNKFAGTPPRDYDVFKMTPNNY